MKYLNFPRWLQFQNLRPWWLKLLLLILAGSPLFSSLPATLLGSFLAKNYPELPGPILVVPLLTMLIWSICLPSLGLRKFLDYMAGAFVLALTTVITGAVLRRMLPMSFIGPGDPNLRLVQLYFNILAVFPYSLTFINAFSVSALIQRLSLTNGKHRLAGLHLALTLRIFQHVGEVVTRLLLVWREEHPELLLPRHRADWRGLAILWSWPIWLLQSIYQWIFACIILTFEPIPVMVNEIEQLAEVGDSNARD